VPYPEKKSYNRVSINFNENAGKILSESSLPPTLSIAAGVAFDDGQARTNDD